MATEVSGIILDTRELDRLTKALEPRAENLIGKAAKRVEEKAKTLSPRDPARMPKDPSQPVTGHLRSSILAKQEQRFLWYVRVGADYGIYQEFGTYKMQARPFLSPAVEWERPEFMKMWEELFK